MAAIADIEVFWNGNWYVVEKDGAFAAAITLYPYCNVELRDLNTPLLVLIGAMDDNASALACKNMVEQTRADRKVDLHVYPKAGHGFDGPWTGWAHEGEAATDARDRIRQFLEKHLY